MFRRGIIRLILAVVAAGFGWLGPQETTCAVAQSSSCRSTCLDRYNRCRIVNKGAPSCDAEYQACLQGCIAPR